MQQEVMANERQRRQQMGGGGMRRGNATTRWTRGPREAELEVTAQHEEWLGNSNERRSYWQIGGGSVRRGYATTSRTRGMGGNAATRGDSAIEEIRP